MLIKNIFLLSLISLIVESGIGADDQPDRDNPWEKRGGLLKKLKQGTEEEIKEENQQTKKEKLQSHDIYCVKKSTGFRIVPHFTKNGNIVYQNNIFCEKSKPYIVKREAEDWVTYLRAKGSFYFTDDSNESLVFLLRKDLLDALVLECINKETSKNELVVFKIAMGHSSSGTFNVMMNFRRQDARPLQDVNDPFKKVSQENIPHIYGKELRVNVHFYYSDKRGNLTNNDTAEILYTCSELIKGLSLDSLDWSG